MKRLRHIAWNGLVTVLALLCAVTGIAWVRSYFVCDLIQRNVRGGYSDFYSTYGKIGFYRTGKDDSFARGDWIPVGQAVYFYSRNEPSAYDLDPHAPSFPLTIYEFAGFSFTTDKPEVTHGFWGQMLVIPYWFLALVFGISPSYALVVYVRGKRRRARMGRCSICGYDLRATPDCCPECGTIPGGKPKGTT